jgi:hypothetical protein
MKKKFLLIFFAFALLTSCSNVKVLNSFRADHADGIRDNNILVVARAAKPDARKAFEDEITKEIRARGINATPSYTKFPKLRPDQKLTEDRKNEIKDLLEKEGFNGVVLSVLKDYQELTRSVGEGGYEASVNYGYTDLPTYYGWGFYAYYHHPLSYSNEDVYVKESEDTITSRLFILETVAYNLEEPEDKQLVAVIRSQVENPDGVVSTANNYAKAIAKRFKK